MTFTIIYKGEVYDAKIMSPDGSFELDGWLQFEPEVPWLGYYVEHPNSLGASRIETEKMEIFLPDESTCESCGSGNLERRLEFCSLAPPGLLGVEVDGEKLFIQGKPISDYLHNMLSDYIHYKE